MCSELLLSAFTFVKSKCPLRQSSTRACICSKLSRHHDKCDANCVPQVVASCLDTLQPIILDNFSSREDLQQCLRASAQVPAVAGDPIDHRGRRLVDAAVFEPVPFRAAISDGCTHVITLCSRPPMK